MSGPAHGWKLWWMLLPKDDLRGLLIGGGLVIGTAAVAAAILIPIEQSRVEGVVTGFGLRETEQGSYHVITVQTADGAYTVRARGHHDCRAGDQITLSQGRHWWGKSAGVGLADRDLCRRPFSQQ